MSRYVLQQVIATDGLDVLSGPEDCPAKRCTLNTYQSPLSAKHSTESETYKK